MRRVLLAFEARGLLTLPPVERNEVTIQPIIHTERTEKAEGITSNAGKLSPLRVQIAVSKDDQILWNEYIDRYHYLGYTKLAGEQMKYFLYSGDRVIALLGFSAAAWRVAPRDWFIGWSDEKRTKNLKGVST